MDLEEDEEEVNVDNAQSLSLPAMVGGCVSRDANTGSPSKILGGLASRGSAMGLPQTVLCFAGCSCQGIAKQRSIGWLCESRGCLKPKQGTHS